ncbi:hypothetical protein MY10362_000349 [Beauveria mimosiformis]
MDTSSTPTMAGEPVEMLVQSMFKLALEDLFYMKTITKLAKLEMLYERLKGWGLGLFQGTYSLTRMLAQNHVPGGQCSAFHTVLVSILLGIEELVPVLQSENQALLTFRKTLGRFLAASGPLRQDILTSRQRLRGEAEPDIAWLVAYMEEEVKNLFMLLPLVESMRNGYAPPPQLREADTVHPCRKANHKVVPRNTRELLINEEETVRQAMVVSVDGSVDLA